MGRKETENVCNMPKLLTLEVHRSEETGRYYLEFLDTSGMTANQGVWSNRGFSKAKFISLMKELYPDFDGKHKPMQCRPYWELECTWCSVEGCPRKNEAPEAYTKWLAERRRTFLEKMRKDLEGKGGGQNA